MPCLCSLLKPFGDADMAIDVVEFGSDWEKLSSVQFTMQHSFFNPHDFAVTPHNYLFFQVTKNHSPQLRSPQCKVDELYAYRPWTAQLIAPQAVPAQLQRYMDSSRPGMKFHIADVHDFVLRASRHSSNGRSSRALITPHAGRMLHV